MLDRKLYRIKNYPRGYKKRLKRINKTRERLNVANYITNVFNDLEDAYYDYLAYGDPLRHMNGQLIDKTSDEYLFDVDPNWLEYLGRNWTLEDELAYCDKVFATYDVEEEYNFTEEEINYYRNSYKLSCEKNKVETDPVKRAMNAYQPIKDYQDAWQKYSSKEISALYFDITNEEEAQEWLEEFCKDIE